MKTWQDFLNSLATRGGNLLLLAAFVIALGFLVYHVLHHGDASSEAKTVIMSTFSAFTGALLAALRGVIPSNGGKTPNGAQEAPKQ